MKVLMLAPLWFPVAKDAPGGIETLLFALTEALLQQGCEVTMLASGDSRTAAVTVPVVAENLYSRMSAGTAWEYPYYEQHQLQLATQLADRFDIVHSHVGAGAFVLSGVPGAGTRVLHSIHTPVGADLAWFAGQHPGLWFSTVSEFQAAELRRGGATRCRVIPNGIKVEDFTCGQGGDGLLFLGRIEPGKGPDLAVQAALKLGRPLTLGGPIVDRAYFSERVEPFLGDRIRYLGVVDHGAKDRLFGEAGCLLVPSRHAEAFGMVGIEAMSCGTPVVALASGALPEIVEPGVTGYIAESKAVLAPLAMAAMRLNRAEIRARAIARFHISNVAEQYLGLYSEIRGAAGCADHSL